MMRIVLLALALGGLVYPFWAADQVDAGSHADPDGASATSDAGNHFDPNG